MIGISDRWKSSLIRELTEHSPIDLIHNQMRARLVDGSPIRFAPMQNPKQSAVCILLYPDSDGIHFPLIRRPVYKGVHSGQIALPGGKYEETDVDLVYTALREMEEEVGVNKNSVEVLGTLSKFWVGASNFEVLPVVAWTEEKPLFIPDNKEVESILHASCSHLVLPESKGQMEMEVNSYRILAPYFAVQGQAVWGATAMILNEFCYKISRL